MRLTLILYYIGAALFCLALTAALHPGACSEDGPYPGFSVGVQSYCFRNFNLDETLRNTQELALKNIEFYGKHASHEMSAQEIEAIKAKLKDTGIKVVAYGVVGFGADEAANERIFKFAKDMGIGVITADPAPESFDSLEKLVKKYDIKIAIHNHGPGSRYCTLEDVLNPIKGRDVRIGACIDNGHFQRAKVDSVQAVKALGNRVHLVHVKDPDKQGNDKILGEGAADIPGLLKALKEIGFKGPLNLEYEMEPENPTDSMKKCLKYLSKVCQEIK